MTRFTQNTLIITCILGATAIIIGAFGAHALETHLTPDQLGTYQTGVSYHFYHVLALLFVSLLSMGEANINLRWPVILFVMGILLFSGSLYMISTQQLHSIPPGLLGPITPLGGALFIAGWLVLGIGIGRYQIQKDK